MQSGDWIGSTVWSQGEELEFDCRGGGRGGEMWIDSRDTLEITMRGFSVRLNVWCGGAVCPNKP